MVTTTIYTITSVVIVSLVSVIGIITLLFSKQKIENILITLVSISAGTLIGGAFFHLIPDAVEESGSFSISISFLIIAGISIFFLLDNLIHWKHTHSESSLIHTAKEHKPNIAYLNLLGDGIHNFLDGLIIAGSYLISIPTGLATTLAIIVHEIPQEIADFGVLIYSGFSKRKALLFNFYSATAAIIGGIIGIILGSRSHTFIAITIPFAAGGFIYIAGSNLIPEILQKNHKLTFLIKQFLAFLLGILIMYGLLFLE